MKELNDLVKTCKVDAYGFQAFKDLSAMSNQDSKNKICISTLSPAVMYSMGITRYYAPILPRGIVFHTAGEVISADLMCNLINIYSAPEIKSSDNVYICSRHQGTIAIVKDIYPYAVILPESVTPGDIQDKNVVGTLPAHLVQYCRRYQALTITEFDYSKEGDLSGEELRKRLVFNKTITVSVE